MGDSDIPSVAAAIRAGEMPALPTFDPSRPDREGVFLLRTPTPQVAGGVLQAFEAMAGPPRPEGGRDALRALHAARVQILGTTLGGVCGVRALSDAIESRWLAGGTPIHDWGLAVGSRILWTRNSYDHPVGLGRDRDRTVDIMNGSLGIVQREFGEGAAVLFDDAEGTVAEIRHADLERVMRGWAITVHKAQGSAFDRIVFPISRTRMLDRLLLYTAVTRARRTVVLVGDEAVLAEAIAAEPRVASRRQAIDIDSAVAVLKHGQIA